MSCSAVLSQRRRFSYPGLKTLFFCFFWLLDRMIVVEHLGESVGQDFYSLSRVKADGSENSLNYTLLCFLILVYFVCGFFVLFKLSHYLSVT